MKANKVMILNEIKSHYKLQKGADFARFLGIKPQTLSSWYARSSFDIELLYAKCVDINPDWLLTGTGGMLRNHQQIGNIDNSNVVGANVNGNGININGTSSELIDVIKKQQEQIGELIGIINRYGK